MDFSLTTLFVLPAGNTLPVAGSTDALTPGQFGVFTSKYAVATAGNIAAQPYIYLAQGRIEQVPGLGSKRSDKIKNGASLIEWYKVPAITTSQVQISAIGNTGEVGNTDTITAKCDESYSVTLRLFSSYIDLGYFNGLTRSFTYQTECCDGCAGGDCESANIENLVDYFVNAINTDPLVSQYITASKVEQGVAPDQLWGILLTGKPLNKYGQPCDITAFPYEYDKLRFQTFAYKGADTTQDYLVYDRCENTPVTVLQESTYPTGSSDEIKLLEMRYHSYQTTYKHIFRWPIWNGAFTSYVVDGTFYDTYYIKFKDLELHTWNDYVDQDEMVIIAVPTGQGAALETLLSTYLGTIVNYATT